MLQGRSMAHGESAAGGFCSGGDLEIVLGAKVANLKLTQTDNAECRRFHPSDANNPARAWSEQGLGRRARQRKIEDLVGLLARHRCFIERAQIVVGLEHGERLARLLGSCAVNKARRTRPR